MLALCQVLKENKDFATLLQKLNAGECPIALSGLSSVHKAHIISAVRMETKRQVVCIYADELDARRAARDISVMCDEEARILPSLELSLHDVDSSSNESMHERLATLKALADGSSGVTLAPVFSLMQRCAPPEGILGKTLTLKTGEELSQEALCEKLVSHGYCRCEQVEAEGQFAVRGGIVDIFSPGKENPVRVEFFGDEIDSMGAFECDTQRRIDNLRSCELLPASTAESGEISALSEKGTRQIFKPHLRRALYCA